MFWDHFKGIKETAPFLQELFIIASRLQNFVHVWKTKREKKYILFLYLFDWIDRRASNFFANIKN